MANTQVYVGETGAKELYRKVKAKIEDLGTAVEGELGLKADKTELESAVDTINESLSDINTELATKADESELNDAVADINSELDGKSDIGHTHVKADITDFDHNHDDRYYTETEIDGFLGNKEDISNKITAFDEQTTNTQYPSALLVKNEIARLQRIIADLGGFEVVTSLVDGHPNPAIPSHKIIYLYKDPDGPAADPYTEWIYTVDEEWDVIGTTYVDLTPYYTSDAVDTLLATKVDKVTGKGLSTNDYTDADKGKLDNIESGAEVNLIESVKVDGSALTIDANKAVDIPLASATASGNETVYVTGVVTGQDKQKWDDWTSASVDIPPINGVKIGGRKYEVKKFGDRVWMMESLKYDTDVPNALYINESQGVYYYTGDYLLRGDELATIIPAGWRVPTISDRDALVAVAGGTNEDGARYLFNNFNVERSTYYDGYHAYPGGYLSDWQFCVATDGNGPVGAILIQNTTTPTLVNSNNSGGGGYDARFPVRLCRDALQGE